MFKSNRTVAKSDIRQLDLTTRHEIEAKITDARTEELDFERIKGKDTSIERYASSSPSRRYVFDFLGPLQGKTILDIGCGYSMTPVMFALAGATVYAIDVAPQTIAAVQKFAEFKGVADRVAAKVSPAETLPFPDESFDLVYGGAALHHLDLRLAGPEITRVLRRGGKGGFQDPFGHNPLLEFARDHLPYKGKHPAKGTDLPLKITDIENFSRNFTSCQWQGFELFSMIAKPLNWRGAARRALERIDEHLLGKIPFIQRYARFVVTCVIK